MLKNSAMIALPKAQQAQSIGRNLSYLDVFVMVRI
jgi:hypothetical protein